MATHSSKKLFYKSGGPFADNELKFDGIKKMEDAIRNCDTYNFYNKNIPSVLLSSGGFNEITTSQPIK